MLNPFCDSPKLVLKYKYSLLSVDMMILGLLSILPVSLAIVGLFGESPSLIRM